MFGPLGAVAAFIMGKVIENAIKDSAHASESAAELLDVVGRRISQETHVEQHVLDGQPTVRRRIEVTWVVEHILEPRTGRRF